VAPGRCLPGALTDPDMHDSRIRLRVTSRTMPSRRQKVSPKVPV